MDDDPEDVAADDDSEDEDTNEDRLEDDAPDDDDDDSSKAPMSGMTEGRESTLVFVTAVRLPTMSITLTLLELKMYTSPLCVER